MFDIDPYIYSGKEAKGAEPELNRRGFATGKRVAFWLHELLREMSLRAIVKTSGKTGLHVFVPIERTVTFDEARHICETVGRHVMREHPKDITMEWAVEKRTGKIFIDYNMNVARQDPERRLLAPGRSRGPGFHAAELGGARGRRADGLYNQGRTVALGKDRRQVA